eukprot:gene3378-642_t
MASAIAYHGDVPEGPISEKPSPHNNPPRDAHSCGIANGQLNGGGVKHDQVSVNSVSVRDADDNSLIAYPHHKAQVWQFKARYAMFLVPAALVCLLAMAAFMVAIVALAEATDRQDGVAAAPAATVTGLQSARPDRNIANLQAFPTGLPLRLAAERTRSSGYSAAGPLWSGTGEWVRKPPMPAPRSDMMAVQAPAGSGLASEVILLIGGILSDGQPTNLLEIFDPVLESYMPGVPMETARARFGVAHVDGKVAVCGGVGASPQGGFGDALDTCEVYDVGAGTWSAGPVMSSPRSDLAGAGLGGKAYMFGGYAPDFTPLAACESLDLTSGLITACTDMPTPRGDIAAVTAQGGIYVLGGWNMQVDTAYGAFTSAVERYEVSSGMWSPVASLQTAKGDKSAASLGGLIYSVGGETWSGTFGPCDWDPSVLCKRDGLSWLVVVRPGLAWSGSRTELVWARSGPGAASQPVCDVVRSGLDWCGYAPKINKVAIHECEHYDPQHGEWVPCCPLPEVRFRSTSAAAHGTIWVFGGQQHRQEVVAEVFAFYDAERPQVFMHVASSADTQAPDSPTLAVSLSPTPPTGYEFGGSLLPGSDEWVPKPALPAPVSGMQAVFAESEGIILLSGGLTANQQVSAAVYAFDVTYETYTRKAPMPVARHQHGSAYISGKLYVAGGLQQTASPILTSTGCVLTPGPFMSQPRSDLAVCAVEGRLYAIGGFGPNYELDDTGSIVEEFDPATNQWTTKASMPTSRGGLTVASLGAWIYVVGGWTKETASATGYFTAAVERYLPSSNQWEQVTSIPVANAGGGLAQLNGHLYSFGGQVWGSETAACPGDSCESSRIPLHACYRLTTGLGSHRGFNLGEAWVPCAALPHSVKGLAATSAGGVVWTFGGQQPGQAATDLVSAYYDVKEEDIFFHIPTATADKALANPHGLVISTTAVPPPRHKLLTPLQIGIGEWTDKPSLPSPASDMAAVFLEQEHVVLLIGGFGSDRLAKSDVIAFDPNNGVFVGARASMPVARARFAAAYLDGKVFVAGGVDTPSGAGSDTALDSLHIYEPSSDTWFSGPPMQEARSDVGGAAANGIFYVIGGFDRNFNLLDRVEGFDPLRHTWSESAPMPTPRGDLGVVQLGGLLYAMGGWNMQDDPEYGSFTSAFESYNPDLDVWVALPPLPVAKGDKGVAADRDQIYSFGGEVWSGRFGPCDWDHTASCKINQLPGSALPQSPLPVQYGPLAASNKD